MAEKPKPPSIMDRYPGAVRKAPVVQESDGSSGTTIKMIIAVVVMLIAGVAAVFVLKSLGGSSKAPTGPMLGEDARIVEMMDENGVKELREWLKINETRMVLGQTRDQSFTMADRFYKMGAKKVYAFDGGLMTLTVVVELPDAAAQRGPIFEWYGDRWLSRDNTVSKDVGQKYLLLIMSP